MVAHLIDGLLFLLKAFTILTVITGLSLLALYARDYLLDVWDAWRGDE